MRNCASWMRLLAQARNPYALQGLWIPDSRCATSGMTKDSFTAPLHQSVRALPILPDGQIGKNLSSPACKNFLLHLLSKSVASGGVPRPQEGRIAIVTDVGFGMRWTRGRRKTNGGFRGRRSRVVLTPRRWRQVGDDACASRWRWWQQSPVTRESAK